MGISLKPAVCLRAFSLYSGFSQGSCSKKICPSSLHRNIPGDSEKLLLRLKNVEENTYIVYNYYGDGL